MLAKMFKKTFFIVCAGICIALFILIFYMGFTLADDLEAGEKPSIFGFTPTLVITGSMEPTINVDSLNLYIKCKAEDINVGDIVVFWSDEHQIDVIHRAIEVTEVNGNRAIVTQGDANELPDKGYVTNDNIVGRLTHTFNWSVPYVQRVMNYNRTEIDTVVLSSYLIVAVVVLWVILVGIYSMIVGLLVLIDRCYERYKSRRSYNE